MAFGFPATFASPPSSVTFEHERVMDPACLRHTELPGTSKLFADFSYHFDRVARFYSHNPHEPASYESAAREIQYPDDRRAKCRHGLREVGAKAAVGIVDGVIDVLQELAVDLLVDAVKHGAGVDRQADGLGRSQSGGQTEHCRFGHVSTVRHTGRQRKW